MTVKEYKDSKNCGYSAFAQWGRERSVADNIKKIRMRNQVNNVTVKTVKVDDFEKESVEIASAYNPPKIRTLTTDMSTGEHALVSNLQIGEKTVQFVCVDGNNLSEWEFQNPDVVIDRVNSGILKPVVLTDLNRLSSNEMTMVDAYAGSIWYCLFLWEIFERVAIIDDSQVFLSVVNVDMANAFWNSHYMTYGNGNQPGAPKMGPLTSIDVVGHESGHGIIEALGNLTYQGESGALNESIADIFGTCLEKYYDIRSKKNLFDWDLGEDFMVGGMRSLANPKSHDQPDTYGGRNWVDPNSNFDNGGVHINSGVNNYFFYSVASGATGKNDNGVQYHVDKNIAIFPLAKFIYLSLKGAPGYRKITSNVNYHQYTDCLLANYAHFLETNEMDANLSESILEGLIAVGLQVRKNVPPNPDDEGNTGGTDNKDDTNNGGGGDKEGRKIIWSTDFVKGSPFYTYGLGYRTNNGLLVFTGSETVAAFNLSGLKSPAVHLTGNFGNNNLSVQLNVNGQVYQRVISESSVITIPGVVHNKVVVSLKPVAKTWWPGWTQLTGVAFSAQM